MPHRSSMTSLLETPLSGAKRHLGQRFWLPRQVASTLAQGPASYASRGPATRRRPTAQQQPLEDGGGCWRSCASLGIGAGVALLAKGSRRSRQGVSLSQQRKERNDDDNDLQGLEAWASDNPLDTGLSEEEEPDDESPAKPKEEYSDGDALAFWDEQKRPTLGPGGRPRVQAGLPLPDPLPCLDPDGPDAEGHEEEEGQDDAGTAHPDAGGDPPPDFSETYDQVESVIMDINGERLRVPPFASYEQAANELEFPPFLRAALADLKFFRLTPVQKCAFPLLIAGRDVMASAFTGSGKTAAFILPILARLHHSSRIQPGALVASHFKDKDGKRSTKPVLGRVKGMKVGYAAVEFELATGVIRRQLVPPNWVVGAPEPPPPSIWRGPAMPYAIVLVPTRELSDQVHKEACRLTTYSAFRSVSLTSGPNPRSGLRDLAHGADIVVTTPGRLVDALHKGIIKLDNVYHVVLDEVDRMMELGFGSQLQEIVEQGGMPPTSAGRQTSFWSATIPHSVRQLAEAFLGRECIWVDCTGGKQNPVPNTIEHVLVDARPPHRVLRQFEEGCEVVTKGGRRGIAEFRVGKRWRVQFSDGELVERQMLQKGQIFLSTNKTKAIEQDKIDMLKSVLLSREFRKASVIIFCRKRETVEKVYKELKEDFLGVVTCHGGMTQSYRSKAVRKMKEGEAEVLVATDIAARGLDIPNVSHIINFEMPRAVDEFVHRCGRTGRIGRKGTAVTFVNGREYLFKGVRRTILQQGNKVPDWFSLEGMQLPWRPRFYRMPFTKEQEGLEKDATSSERFAKMEKHRDRQLRMKAALMRHAHAVAKGEERQSLGFNRDIKILEPDADPQPQEVGQV